MKRTVYLAALLALTLVSACQSKEQVFVGKAIRLMDKHGLFAEGPAWDQMRAAALMERPASMDEAYAITRAALKVAGGKHSFILTEEMSQKSAEIDKNTEPSVTPLDDGILLIVLPAYSSLTIEEEQRYTNSVLEALPESGSLQGVIIDLRGNSGGNMYPMIAAVHRFMPDDDILKFKSRRSTMPIPRSYVLRSVGLEAQPQINCPVALLTDEGTASSAEATLLCFRGLDYARTFGAPTAGYASANTPYPLPDGSRLLLTTGCDMARTGEIFCDDPIVPDLVTDQPLEEALAWIRER